MAIDRSGSGLSSGPSPRVGVFKASATTPGKVPGRRKLSPSRRPASTGVLRRLRRPWCGNGRGRWRWFEQVAWDIGVVARSPDHRRLSLLTATDTD
ncbi:DUF6183 family protein [Streptomyces mesophilus]|uniref:DUF6183 family protein n=1 Tax=Streptomyces mesophilus TaxID=1775132 RepID=UPI001F40F3BF|nr:DUF6183 family protein [Streptomyces mesophilus]